MTEYRLAVFGAGVTGKSTLTIRFAEGRILTEYDPMIDETYKRAIAIDNERVELNILDVSGQNDFAPLLAQCMREANGFIIVYAIDDRVSFEEVERLHREFLRVRGEKNVPVVICGNKCDLEVKRVVSKAEGEELAERLNAKFFETSALTNLHVEDAFRTLVREIRKLEPPSQPSKKNESTSEKKGRQRGRRNGCLPS